MDDDAVSGDPTRINMRTDPATERMSGIAVHGRTRFDVPFISPIEGNLWQGGCRDGLVLPDFIEHVISLYPWERYALKHEVKSSLTVRMYDDALGRQAFDQVDTIAAWVNWCVDDGPTLVHCQAGLNRSSLIAARALMLRGRRASTAIAMLRDRRSPACLCNPAFEAHLLGLDK